MKDSEMKSSWIVGWALKLMASVVRDRQRDTDTEGRGEGDVKPEAEIRGAKPRAGAPGDTRVGRSREGLSGREERGPWPCQCLEFRFMVSGTVGEKIHFCSFKPGCLWSLSTAARNPLQDFSEIEFGQKRQDKHLLLPLYLSIYRITNGSSSNLQN